MNESISSLLNEVKIATQDYVAAKVRAGQLSDAEMGIAMLKALESPISIAEKLSATKSVGGKSGSTVNGAEVAENHMDIVAVKPPYKTNRIRGMNHSFSDEPPFYFISNFKLYKVGKLNGNGKKPYYKKMVPLEELPYLLETLIGLLSLGRGKVSVKDYLETIKLDAPKTYGRKISEYRCYVVVGALEKAEILEQKERGKYCYVTDQALGSEEIIGRLHKLERREELLSQAE